MRVALLADFLEERWPSMDLVAEMMADEFRRTELSVDLLRPPMRRRFSGARQFSGKGYTLDRLLNRFHDYPAYLKRVRHGFDLFHLADHSYSQLVHALPSGRTVVTCHDLDTFRSLWESPRGGRGRLFRAMTGRILSGMQKAAHVCCDSDATRDEILARGLLPPERTSVVRLGLRPELTASPDPDAEARLDDLLATKGDPAPRVDLLHVGSTIARKRIDLLLEVFARIKREEEPAARLLRVGGAFTAAQQAQAERLGLGESDVRVLPFLSPLELASVYRRATLVLLPSDGEGFGFPVIEALACATPVLATDLPVLREVGGEAAVYAPPGDVNAWVRMAGELLGCARTEPATWRARRQQCQKQGTKFTWAQTAKEMAEVYRRAAGSLRC